MFQTNFSKKVLDPGQNFRMSFCLVLFCSIVLINSSAAEVTSAPSSPSGSTSKISSSLLTKFKNDKNSFTTIIISMTAKKPITTILEKATTTHHQSQSSFSGKPLKFSSRGSKLTSIVEALQAEADSVQNDLLNFLKNEQKSNSNHQTTVHQLWITNQVIVKGADWSLIEKLGGRTDVSGIDEEKLIPLEEPMDFRILEGSQNFTLAAADDEIQWGVRAINAPRIWTEFGNRGQNVVIGSIDTGARHTHEALKDNYRSNFGWYDGMGHTSTIGSPKMTPFDDHGHGTHTLGTAVGSVRGVGVAPKAQWVSCRACDGGCTDAALLLCGQWMACPVLPDNSKKDCSMAPHIVSNSWGGPGMDPFFDDVVKMWHAGGIIPIFSIGNDGRKGCETTGSPGNYEEVIGVGSVTTTNTVSSFSSLGPVRNSMGLRITKPDIVAPGSDIISAYSGHDAQYVVASGTSMACPHVSGLVALMLSQHGDLTYGEVKERLQNGAVSTSQVSGRNCGGQDESRYPNNHAGYGRVDAYNSLTNSAPLVMAANSIFLMGSLLIVKLFFC